VVAEIAPCPLFLESDAKSEPQWTEIAGPGLGAVTRPLAFTGKKARRLVICVEDTAIAPWGGWTCLSSDESKRRSFTQFRRAVNDAIAPHEVDHIEFITSVV